MNLPQEKKYFSPFITTIFIVVIILCCFIIVVNIYDNIFTGALSLNIEKIENNYALLVFLLLIYSIHWLYILVKVIKSDFKKDNNKTIWIILLIFIPFVNIIFYFFQEQIQDKNDESLYINSIHKKQFQQNYHNQTNDKSIKQKRYNHKDDADADIAKTAIYKNLKHKIEKSINPTDPTETKPKKIKRDETPYNLEQTPENMEEIFRLSAEKYKKRFENDK